MPERPRFPLSVDDPTLVRVFASSLANSRAGTADSGKLLFVGHNEIGIDGLMILYFTSVARISVNSECGCSDGARGAGLWDERRGKSVSFGEYRREHRVPARSMAVGR